MNAPSIVLLYSELSLLTNFYLQLLYLGTFSSVFGISIITASYICIEQRLYWGIFVRKGKIIGSNAPLTVLLITVGNIPLLVY